MNLLHQRGGSWRSARGRVENGPAARSLCKILLIPAAGVRAGWAFLIRPEPISPDREKRGEKGFALSRSCSTTCEIACVSGTPIAVLQIFTNRTLLPTTEDAHDCQTCSQRPGALHRGHRC